MTMIANPPTIYKPLSATLDDLMARLDRICRATPPVNDAGICVACGGQGVQFANGAESVCPCTREWGR